MAALRHRGRQATTRARPGHGDAIGVNPQLVGVFAHPLQSGHAVVKCCRKRVFGRKPIIGCHDVRSQIPRNPPVSHQLELWRSDDHAAAVQ